VTGLSLLGVRHERGVRIPLRDGSWAAADLFLPETDEQVPALLELLPYRKDDSTAARWDTHWWFAERGHAGVRVDVRGTGSSPGVAVDEYTLDEQLDACDVIAWLADQPWCNGRVGMFGTSYGGFNAIQVAMHAPPALGAIAPHAATDERYLDDVHHIGGCLAGIDLAVYPLWMVGLNALPPDPDLAGADWAGIWDEHLGADPWLLTWLREQTDGPYWQHGSLAVDYGSIRCPVLHLGGWNDGYVNAVFRMAEHMEVPYRAIVGPWDHSRPNTSGIRPRVDHLSEMLRWFDRWLKDEPNGVEDEPPVVLFVQEGRPPARFPGTVPGHWRAEAAWPPARQEVRELVLGDGTLGLAGGGLSAPVRHRHDPTLGTASAFWCPGGGPYGLAADQRDDDARSLRFDTEPLIEPVEVLGTATLALDVAWDTPVGFVVAKLCDVGPDGSSTLVTRGWLNGTHRWSHAAPEPLEPGRVEQVEVPLRATSWVVPAGHRLRLSLSSSDFPTIWPSPFASTMEVNGGRLALPVVGPQDPALPVPVLGPPPELRATARVTAPDGATWEIVEDELTGATTVRVAWGTSTEPRGTGTRLDTAAEQEATARPEDPAHTRVRGTQRYTLHEQSGAVTAVVATGSVRSTAEHLHAEIGLRVDRDGTEVLHRTWRETIPRHLL